MLITYPSLILWLSSTHATLCDQFYFLSLNVKKIVGRKTNPAKIP